MNMPFPTTRLACLSVLFAVAWCGSTARGTTIDFEAQGAGAPSVFTGMTDSPLTIGIATFTGGQLLNNETNSVDLTAVYATSNLVGGGYTDPLVIAFNQPVSGFSILVTNQIAGAYTVMDNLGGLQTMMLGLNQSFTFSLSDVGISSVTITGVSGSSWDFAVDDVTFASASVPDSGATIVLMAIALAPFVALARRRSFAR